MPRDECFLVGLGPLPDESMRGSTLLLHPREATHSLLDRLRSAVHLL